MYLEVKDLKKVYKIKKADPVNALNGVSLTFPENGLVFILGKSGSGKSTLLNVMGGLDTPDSGEIIINGKSSKDFDSSELDSYRNTYLGFIFQEYNILNDFTVRDNIALALELQHKKAEDEVINKILEEVDLTGYAKRKPNELSGGQKQRVAIARALVKEPKILFADEPTGALDSATGLAVFETLKKLSKTRLVVVVSHDRDFAERFGDRVIELKDGNVISDITKVEEDVVNETGISLYGTNLIRIEKGHKLTKEDVDMINAKLASSETDAYFSIDSRINDSVNSAAMINERGKKESFIMTSEDEKLKAPREKEKWSVVKSKFPASAAFKMGAKSLRIKPFRLVLTILISFAAFAMFGISVAFARMNRVETSVNSISKSNETTIAVGYINGDFGESKRLALEDKTGIEFDKIYYMSGNPGLVKSLDNYRYYNNQIRGAAYIDIVSDNKYDLSLVAGGVYPTNIGEVAITMDMYNTYKAYGIRDARDYASYIEADNVNPTNILGKYISLTTGNNYEYYKIVGIVDTKIDIQKYEKLLTANTNDYSEEISNLQQELDYLRRSTLASVVFVSREQAEKFSTVESVHFEGTTRVILKYTDSYGADAWTYPTFDMTKDDQVFFDSTKTVLGENEILINYNQHMEFLNNYRGFTVEEDASNTKNYEFPTVFTSVSGKALQSPYNCDTNFYEISGWREEEIAHYIYAQEHYLGQKKEPRLAQELYNWYSWDSTATELLFEEDEGGTDLKYETYGDVSYPIIDWDGVETYYSNNDSGIYANIFNILHNLDLQISNIPSSLSECRADALSAAESAHDLIVDTVYKQYPNAYSQYLMQSISVTNYSEADAEYFYETYKTSDLKNIYEADTGNELTESDKWNFICWYLYAFNNGDAEALGLDATYYNSRLANVIESVRTYITSGDIPADDIELTFTKQVGWTGDNDEELTKKIVGVYFNNNGDMWNWHFYMQKDEIMAIDPDAASAKFSSLITPMPTRDKLSKLMEVYYASKDEDVNVNKGHYDVYSPTLNSISMWVGLISDLGMIFLYSGLGAAVFSMLLFYNFISISINNKRHEIGVLRAVGARGTDVFKIFYSESLIIGLINFVLAVVSVFAVTIGINMKINELIPGLVLLNTGIIEILAVLGLSLFASFVSALLPVTRLARQKPIDAIREK